jgi:hypothetical protein
MASIDQDILEKGSHSIVIINDQDGEGLPNFFPHLLPPFYPSPS